MGAVLTDVEARKSSLELKQASQVLAEARPPRSCLRLVGWRKKRREGKNRGKGPVIVAYMVSF